MNRSNFLSVFGVLALLILITAAIVLYAQGFRLDLGRGGYTKTGMILVKSVPDGARVLLDGKLAAATDSTIPSLTEGTYRIKIEKEGYVPWEKDVEVKAELVTGVTALLPPLSPSLTAITQNGARLVAPAPSGTKAAFISKGKLFLLPLNSQFLGFLRTRPQEIGKGSTGASFAKATRLLFSPNEDQILVITPTKSVLFTIGQGASQTVDDLAKLKSKWADERREHRAEIIQNLEVPSELKDIAISTSAVWAPDERKFLYEKSKDGKKQFWVANLSDPLSVGESVNQKIWETENPDLKLFWLADSSHLVMLENGMVSVLDLDGSNRRELFSGELAESIAFSSSDLAKIIVLTSISPKSAPNLYAISLR
ncbi:MAG: hypothetical protein BMS9Abin34_003 [Patescibacteria group bacterium]|nr:MAG: hypothetical protein BMS9Abin34_003 [Patescibacteria group bacterium]